ncbi:unnamed protein product [Oppiella nova]|uniref:Pyruvate phosphate dikinase AMP/ATP-binding domain-containing protein n=1 Tax=Oppiella nova TaxID=334625 RepID=A0A7R9M1E2_9ACAR|nr:unnamed protein product [Oppiella nova]CAG2168975.1 unnamed protein product [Oppiella nova]
MWRRKTKHKFKNRKENAKRVELSGGKGSSLAVLKGLSEKLIKDNYENPFKVPNGVIVTTNAYQRLLREYKDLSQEIQELEESTQLSTKELKTKCELLKLCFEKRHSRRPRREDSEEMSAAGQMTTYLGVKGLEEIYSSVYFTTSRVKSLSGYRQQYVLYQPTLSRPQLFTCDPITGDERVLEITGNYGLGESVVSASSEPDSIKLSVNIESNSLSKRRHITGIESKVIGQKKTLIKLLENGGTVEEEVIDRSNCCVSDRDLLRLGDIGLEIHKHYGNARDIEWGLMLRRSDRDLLRLGDIGLEIHKHYGNARDIEWGLKGGQIFMLQSRPVTNLDNSYTDYEIMHELDSSHPSEFEITSRAHWGEMYPGASS